MRTFWKILDYFFLLRPTLFFPLWTAVLAGRYNTPSAEYPLALVFIYLGALLGAAYIVNQLADIEGDRDNRKLFLVADNYVSVTLSIILSILLAGGGIAGFYFLHHNYGIAAGVFLVITSICYNVKPFRWKDRPIMSVLVTVFSGGAAFYFGTDPELSYAQVIRGFPYLCAFAAVALLTAIPDMTGDAKTGKRTFPIVYGEDVTVVVSALLCFMSALLALVDNDKIILIAAFVSSPFYALMVLKRSSNRYVVLSIKASIFALSLMAGIKFPWYLALMAAYFFFARWYYKNRFGLTYPNFNIE